MADTEPGPAGPAGPGGPEDMVPGERRPPRFVSWFGAVVRRRVAQPFSPCGLITLFRTRPAETPAPNHGDAAGTPLRRRGGPADLALLSCDVIPTRSPSRPPKVAPKPKPKPKPNLKPSMPAR